MRWSPGAGVCAGQVWVGCTNSNELVDVDPSSRRVVARVSYQAADGVAPSGSVLRVTSDNGPSAAILNPRTGKLSHNVQLSDGFVGDANSDVVAAGDGVWVSSPDEGTLYELRRP